MKLRDDIDIANTWITADTHFGHDNIVGFCHRPEEHEQVMIAEWRAHVPDDATVLHLGDLCYRSNARFKNITAKELTGARKLLIKGNHDHQRFSFYRDSGFRLTKPFGLRLRVTDEGLVLVTEPTSAFSYVVSFSHYPWSPEDPDLIIANEALLRPPRLAMHHWHVHGHIHNNGYQRSFFVPFLRQQINVGVEQTKYRPVNLKALLDAAILGRLPASQEQEDLQAEAARQRSITRRQEAEPS